MKKILTILIVFASIALVSSCQKELPDSLKNVEVNQGGDTPSPDPSNPTQQGDIPSENDNPMPSY